MVYSLQFRRVVMSKTFRSIALMVLAVSLGCQALNAQATASATLQGTIMDKSEAVVGGAAVKATNKDTGLVRSTASNDSGGYRFELLPAGNYEIRVDKTGFAPASAQNVQLLVGRISSLDFTLSPATQVEIVQVMAEAPLIDSQSMDVGLAITPEQVQQLPLNGRDFANLAYLAPGAKPVDSYDPTKNRIAIFGINGSSGRNVNITVNGIDNKDNTVGGPVMQFPLEAIQEFNISTQRFSAANGRSEGAAVNVITRAGGTAWHGGAYLFERNERLNTNDYFSEQSNQPKSPFSRQQFGGSVGGPIRKEKDFVFFALERGREITSIIVDPDAFKELRDCHRINRSVQRV